MAKQYLTRAAILECNDLPHEEVAVPEWGGVVVVRGMTGAERDAFEAESLAGRTNGTGVNMQNIRARLVAASVVDGIDGQKVFKPNDVVKLGQKSAAALQRVFNVAMRLSAITEADVEEIAENLEETPGNGSGSS